MEYAKYISEKEIEKAPKVYILGNKRIANPLPETLLRYGYKPLEETKPSGEPAVGWNLEKRYVELDDKVVQTWVKVQDSQLESEPELEGGE